MAAESLIRPFFFLLLCIIMLVFVPRERILSLLPFGFIAGVFLAASIQIVAVHILRLWEFNYLMPLDLFDIPLFLIAAWGVGEIIFAHLLPRKNYLWTSTFIFTFAAGSTLVEWYFHHMQLIMLLRWHEVLTFFLALGIHVVLGYYLIHKNKLKKNIHLRRRA